jgi:hypothetical protein
MTQLDPLEAMSSYVEEARFRWKHLNLSEAMKHLSDHQTILFRVCFRRCLAGRFKEWNSDAMAMRVSEGVLVICSSGITGVDNR